MKPSSLAPCPQEVEYFEKMEVRDFHNDVLLAEACRTDVERLCAAAKRGATRPIPPPPPQTHTLMGSSKRTSRWSPI